MADVSIVSMTEDRIAGFHAALDAVAKERRYIALIAAPPLAQTTAFVRSILAGGGVQFVAIGGDDRVVGWCDIAASPLAGFRHNGRLGMGLLADYRGRGLGERLARTAITAARGAGMERIELEVFASNDRAIALYVRLGFVVEGTRVRSRKLDGAYDDNVFMALMP